MTAWAFSISHVENTKFIAVVSLGAVLAFVHERLLFILVVRAKGALEHVVVVESAINGAIVALWTRISGSITKLADPTRLTPCAVGDLLSGSDQGHGFLGAVDLVDAALGTVFAGGALVASGVGLSVHHLLTNEASGAVIDNDIGTAIVCGSAVCTVRNCLVFEKVLTNRANRLSLFSSATGRASDAFLFHIGDLVVTEEAEWARVTYSKSFLFRNETIGAVKLMDELVGTMLTDGTLVSNNIA